MKIYGIHNKDAREITKIIKAPMVDVTITSPPYFNLKDYGSKKQIGFRQTYPDYLSDLKTVFDGVFEITKPKGTLWVILDTFKREGEVIPLPFDFANAIKESGWKLQDIIIWRKERTVPWAHKGQTRSMFEYVMFFSKGKDFKYYSDRERDHENLKKWWVKYPERYNPRGKALEEIWNFDIPTQGSWGSGYIDHFCPLPEGLVERIINLTTDEGDIVLDPFSGSGTVPAQAGFMNRKYVGFELNRSYISLFKKYMREKREKKRREYKKTKQKAPDQEKFRELIINLRLLKFSRTLKMQLAKKGVEINKIYVKKIKRTPKENNQVVTAEYTILLEKSVQKIAQALISNYISIPPLSKFGIQPILNYVNDEKTFFRKIPKKKLFVYSTKSPNYYTSSFEEAKSGNKEWFIISEIGARVLEKNWD